MSITAVTFFHGASRRAPSNGWSNKSGWMAAMTVVASALVFGGVQWAGHTRSSDGDAALPVANYSALFPDRRGLPSGLSLAPSPVGSRWLMSDEVRAVRLGARLADLELASRARTAATDASYYDHDPVADWVVAKNSDFVDQFAGDLATALGQLPHGQVAAAWYRLVQQRGRDQATSDWNSMRSARQWALTFHPGLIALGEWLETARAAALRGDAAYFASEQSRAMASAAAKLPALPDTTRSLLTRVDALTSVPAISDFHAVEHALTDALAALTN